MRLKSLTKQVSEITNIEEDIVKEVIDHFFTNVREYVTKGDRAIVRLPRFGSFALKIKNTNRYIKSRIKLFKEKGYTEDQKDKFNMYWRLRNNHINYMKSKRKQYNPNKNG